MGRFTFRVLAALLAVMFLAALTVDFDDTASAAAAAGPHEETRRKVEALIARGDTASALEAAELLFKAVDGLRMSSYASTDAVEDFPDALCEQAVRLLDHPNPVVRATADWTLALRVKKLDGSARQVSKMLRAENPRRKWHAAWLARGPEHDLANDYARQLVHLGRHATPQAVLEDGRKVVARIEAMCTAPDSRPAPRELAALADALRQLEAAAAGGNLDATHAAYLALRTKARTAVVTARADFPAEGFVFYTNPRIPGGVWNVNVAVTGRTNTPFGDLYVKRDVNPAATARPMLDKRRLGDGAVRGIDLHWDADRLLLSWWPKPLDPKAPLGWNHNLNAQIWEMDLATGRLRQLTDPKGYNDIEPCYLPDGSYVFSSDRSSYGNQCAGPFLQDKRCTTLFRLDPKRGPEPVAISNNKDFDRHPHVLNDGTIVFMHWEYQERGLYTSQNAWRSRPDGTNMDAFYKQHISVPYSIRDVQQAPGSDICVATVQGHHDAHNGPVVIFNPTLGINNIESMKLVTPGCQKIEGGLGQVANQVVPEGGVENRGGSYINPFPMSDKAFLVGHDMTGNEVDFAIYYIDVWGNRELLHREKTMSAFEPHPLRKRTTPPIVADTVRPEQTYATVFLEDVYRDLPGVEHGAVKYLRISQRLMMPAPVNHDDPERPFNHLRYLPGDSTAAHFGYWAWAPTRTVGLVRVNDDGSAFFRVPAGLPVFLQALDENYCEVRRMRTSFTLQRGEFRSCTGCHETRHEAVGNSGIFPAEVLQAGPQTPEPPPWGDTTTLDFERDIQPIFSAHCTSCHGQREPAGGIELTDRKIGGFMQSYRSLFGFDPDDPTTVNDIKWHHEFHPESRGDKFITQREAQRIIKAIQRNEGTDQLVSISDRFGDSSITQPYQFGSNRSRLIRVMLDEPTHQQVRQQMGRDTWLKLVTWLDHNASYHGTVIDKSQWQQHQKLSRVWVHLPSPWLPGDTNPTFLNRYDSSQPPQPSPPVTPPAPTPTLSPAAEAR